MRPIAFVSVVVGGFATVASTPAADWRVTPRVSAEQSYSDNIDLAPSAAARHDFVTQVSPGVGLSATGRHLTLDFDYQATLNRYARGTETSRVDHRLQSSGTAEVYEDRLFLDFTATVSQRNVDNQGRISRNTISGSGNRETVAAFQVLPTWRQRFGRIADGVFQYRGGLLENGSGVDTDVNELSASVASGTDFARLPWTLTASLRREQNSTDRTNTFRTVEGSVRYQFTRLYGVRARVGYESASVVSVRDDTSGATLGLTGIWTPSPRTSVEAGIEHQSFGNSFLLSANHRMRKAVFDLSYDESRTTSAQRQFARQLFPFRDAFGDPIENPGLQQVDVAIDDPEVTDETLISRRFSGAVSLRGRRTSGSFRLFHERRDFERSGGDETVFGLDASASRTLSRFGSATVGTYWQRSTFVDGLESDLYGVDVSYRRTIYRDLSASVTYSHARSSSQDPADEYTENRVSASVTMLF